MRTDPLVSAISTEKRRRVLRAIFEYPRRQWSCSALEQITKVSHATVFRAISSFQRGGILKPLKINKKDFIYELVNDSPIVDEVQNILNIYSRTAKKIAMQLVDQIRSKHIRSAMIYGSSVTGKAGPDSDIDIIIILNKFDFNIQKYIQDKAAEISSRVNRTISVTITDKRGFKMNDPFARAIKDSMELLYGKKPY